MPLLWWRCCCVCCGLPKGTAPWVCDSCTHRGEVHHCTQIKEQEKAVMIIPLPLCPSLAAPSRSGAECQPQLRAQHLAPLRCEAPGRDFGQPPGEVPDSCIVIRTLHMMAARQARLASCPALLERQHMAMLLHSSTFRVHAGSPRRSAHLSYFAQTALYHMSKPPAAAAHEMVLLCSAAACCRRSTRPSRTTFGIATPTRPPCCALREHRHHPLQLP